MIGFYFACMVNFQIVLQCRVVSVGECLDIVEITIVFLFVLGLEKVATRGLDLLVRKEVFGVFKYELFFVRQSF